MEHGGWRMANARREMGAGVKAWRLKFWEGSAAVCGLSATMFQIRTRGRARSGFEPAGLFGQNGPWDKKIAADANAGKLDSLIKKAKLGYRSGKATPFP
jgi:hypothetical protein